MLTLLRFVTRVEQKVENRILRLSIYVIGVAGQLHWLAQEIFSSPLASGRWSGRKFLFLNNLAESLRILLLPCFCPDILVIVPAIQVLPGKWAALSQSKQSPPVLGEADIFLHGLSPNNREGGPCETGAALYLLFQPFLESWHYAFCALHTGDL